MLGPKKGGEDGLGRSAVRKIKGPLLAERTLALANCRALECEGGAERAHECTVVHGMHVGGNVLGTCGEREPIG